ncbi:L,D-transpeptidase [Candidatus Woesebacteria bacterium]|nr:L,D-transpeptidase [Candidatus Woesebacteria bacterium]
MARKRKRRRFLLLAPILLLLGVGIFLITAERTKTSFTCSPENFSGTFEESEKLAVFEGQEIEVPSFAGALDKNPVLGVAAPAERWIEVDLSEQKLRAWDGSALYLETPISTGLPWWPTPTGEFRIWIKLRFAKMEGGSGRYYYYLPNVPYIMYFEGGKIPAWKGYGLHGTYWHDAFGTQRSHGCVNLPTPIAEKLFYWVGPVLSEGKWAVYSSEENPGTRIVIHE